MGAEIIHIILGCLLKGDANARMSSLFVDLFRYLLKDYRASAWDLQS